MEKKKFQKLNKATVATVLAVSGITVVAPVVPTKATTTFTDLSPKAEHYEPILELYNRGFIQGYEDGTFRPNNQVTRGQAAKMLAQALGLNTKSLVDPGFSDVPKSNNYYKYVAALASAGIISGYLDGTYRPNEPITRNQMAKILTLGYDFAQSTKLTHEFNDVTTTNANKYYIQTLYDLGVTKGKTPVMYAPFELVTRGQLATFIIRAENVNASSSKIKELGDVTDEYAYINGSKYAIATSLRDMINGANASVLKGAQIEGEIVGNTLKSIKKLTINAEGTKNKILQFNGNDSTFAGELIIQGNYLRFENWYLSGHLTISEATPRTLSMLNPLKNMRLASLDALAFIDWTKPTVPNESDNSSNGGGQLVNPLDKENERMPSIGKYIDFTNCELNRVTIDADRTYLESMETIPHVSVIGGVRQFEIYADIETLYIETDVNTTMYGVSDIETVYKNSHKDLHLNGDSYIDRLIIDSTNGWTNIGDNTYIDTVIIPEGAMPNDVFNDFINDNDQIGNIEDPDGEEVDRNPIEETIIPDYDAPTVTFLDVEVDGNDANFEIHADEEGEYYYMILKSDERPPTIREILDNNIGSLLMEDPDTGEFYDYFDETLDEETEYVIYAVAVDEAGNVSDKEALDFKTRDGTPPVINNLVGTGLIGGTRAQVTFNPSEPGRYRYMILHSTDKAPTLADLREQPEIEVTAEDVSNGVSFVYRGLQAQTQYTVYMIMTDRSGNISAATDGDIAYSAPFWTQALDNVPPRLTKTVLDNSDITDIDREPTKVVLNFSEPLDPETAENVKNYTLGGTGNLKDNPYKVTLSNDGKKVTLEIPSMAAFVNNDTLTVRIRDVEDLAGNKILDNATNNLAIYTYTANTKPILSNLIVNDTETNPIRGEMPKDKAEALADSTDIDSNKVTFNANYTGTYYYLIMPANPGEDVKKPLVSQVVFPKDNYSDTDVFQSNFALASGSGEAVVGDGASLDRGNAYNIYYDPTEIEAENGYYIYMVLRDRNGNYSGVEMQYFLPNKRDWELVNFEFAENKNTTNTVAETDFYYPEKYLDVDDRSYTFDFNMRFNAEMQKASVENESNYQLADDIAKYLEVKDVKLKDDQFNAVLTLGYKTTIDPADIPIANTYMAYYMGDEEDLEITMSGLKTWATSKLEELTGEEEVSANTTTVNLNYVDKVKPRLLGQDPNSSAPISLAYRVNENFRKNTDGTVTQIPAQLELTFSEAVTLPTNASYADFATLVPSLGSTLAINNIQYAKDEEDKNIENKLILTLAGNFGDLERLEMTLKDEPSTSASLLKDKASVSNTVMINPEDASAHKAVYVYRQMPMEIEYANLDAESHSIAPRYQPDGTYIYESKGMVVGLKGGYRYEGMTVHYMQATSLSGNVTANMIVNATSEISDLFGHQEIENLLQTIKFEAPYGTTQVFRNSIGTYIYIVLTDSYGNVSNVVRQQILIDPKDIPK